MPEQPENPQGHTATDARQIYSEAVIDHAMNPRNLGAMNDFDGYTTLTGPCGDTMEIWLKVKSDTITAIYFVTDGCGPSIAAGSMVTELAKGKNIHDALKISQQDVLDALEGMPEESRHCALLAANTLQAAIRDYLAIQREPWKKAYRKY